MATSKSIFEEFLKLSGKMAIEHLGSEETSNISQGKSNTFRKKLNIQQKNLGMRINILQISVLLIYIAILALASFSPGQPTLSFGIVFLLIASIGLIWLLKNTWKQKSLIDITLSSINDLPPPEAIKFIQSIFWTQFNS